MIRSVQQLVAALALAAPSFGPRVEAAVELRGLGERYRLDPLTIVALIRRESRWDPTVVGRLGEVGLGQLRVYCEPGPECEARRAALFGWRLNMRETARRMAGWRRYCEQKVGSGLAIYWLAGYGGRPGVCGHVRRGGRLVATPHPRDLEVLRYRRWLDGAT